MRIYLRTYDPTLLLAIPRALKRIKLGIHKTLPFFGMDIWNAYEMSWLNQKNKPEIAIATFFFPANSINMIESKSLKLYLHSLNQTCFENKKSLIILLKKDLSKIVGTTIQISITTSEKFKNLKIRELNGLLLDTLDIKISNHFTDAKILFSHHNTGVIEEKLYSNLFKSNCPITNQPDWASLQIHYIGNQINREALLKYLISFRSYKAFHEQCVERIFIDILQQCKPKKLSVYARYTRRGGIDINPWRSNFDINTKLFFLNHRTPRQ